MERYRHGAGVVTSLARSLRGGPSKNARLVAWEGAAVPCTYRAHAVGAASWATGRQRLPLPVADFLQRWRRHVPGAHTRVVRAYGLSHSAHTAALAHGRAALG
jgi:hypothetical protein